MLFIRLHVHSCISEIILCVVTYTKRFVILSAFALLVVCKCTKRILGEFTPVITQKEDSVFFWSPDSLQKGQMPSILIFPSMYIRHISFIRIFRKKKIWRFFLQNISRLLYGACVGGRVFSTHNT